MKQPHYGALALLLIGGVIITAENFPAVSLICLIGAAVNVIKGKLWNYEEGRSEENGKGVDACAVRQEDVCRRGSRGHA